ncbi:predicted protein, partial [Thalassiosira pseudonana CCMP1335]
MATASLSSSSCWAFSRSSALTTARLRRSSSTAVSGYGGRRSSSTTNAAAANYLQNQNHRSQSLSANAKRSEQQTRLFSTTEEISDSTTSNLSEEETLASL